MADEQDGGRCIKKKKKGEKEKRPPRKKQTPIEAAVTSWHAKYAEQLEQHCLGDLVAQAPKRWTAYGPLVLLPAGSFTTPGWRGALDRTSMRVGGKASETVETEGPTLLWKTILDEIAGSPGKKAGLTHLAVNEGIPLHSKEETGTEEDGNEKKNNILRSPGGLRMLYGDFGPATLLSAGGGDRGTATLAAEEEEERKKKNNGMLQPTPVTHEDFARAFWVSTKQNGITQIWAPRWTMFSRGNIKEKTRLLEFHAAHPPLSCNSPTSSNTQQQQQQQQGRDPLSHRVISADERRGAVAVDLYAGIGYFAFCYASLGFRVLCWELNPWSVEGLRRGAEANGWSVRVVRPSSPETADQEVMLRDVLAGNDTIVVFLEDNTRAAGRIRRLDELTREKEEEDKKEKKKGHGGLWKRDIMHVNLGLLPSSQGSWETAWDVASETQRAWFHIHENVGVLDIDARRDEIRQWFAGRHGGSAKKTELSVEHVELVKTFAPGVWHCVFDLYLKRDLNEVANTI